MGECFPYALRHKIVRCLLKSYAAHVISRTLVDRKDGMVVEGMTWISVKTNEMPGASQRIPLTKILILMVVQAERGPFSSGG